MVLNRSLNALVGSNVPGTPDPIAGLVHFILRLSASKRVFCRKVTMLPGRSVKPYVGKAWKLANAKARELGWIV